MARDPRRRGGLEGRLEYPEFNTVSKRIRDRREQRRAARQNQMGSFGLGCLGTGLAVFGLGATGALLYGAYGWQVGAELSDQLQVESTAARYGLEFVSGAANGVLGGLIGYTTGFLTFGGRLMSKMTSSIDKSWGRTVAVNTLVPVAAGGVGAFFGYNIGNELSSELGFHQEVSREAAKTGIALAGAGLGYIGGAWLSKIPLAAYNLFFAAKEFRRL